MCVFFCDHPPAHFGDLELTGTKKGFPKSYEKAVLPYICHSSRFEFRRIYHVILYVLAIFGMFFVLIWDTQTSFWSTYLLCIAFSRSFVITMFVTLVVGLFLVLLYKQEFLCNLHVQSRYISLCFRYKETKSRLVEKAVDRHKIVMQSVRL